MAAAVFERISQIPHVAVDVFHLDLVVGQRGAGRWVPVDQSFAAVDQAVVEEFEECVAHGGRTHVVHGETGAFPVTRRSHGLELFEDCCLVFVLPRLGGLDECFAPHIESFDAIGQESLLDNGLGGNASMVSARHPQGWFAQHAVEADEHILQRVVERMAKVERGRDVRWRDHHGVGVSPRVDRHGMERVCRVPLGGDRSLGIGRDVGFFKLAHRSARVIENTLEWSGLIDARSLFRDLVSSFTAPD